MAGKTRNHQFFFQVITIDLITVLEAILMGRQTRLEITVFVWKAESNNFFVKHHFLKKINQELELLALGKGF